MCLKFIVTYKFIIKCESHVKISLKWKKRFLKGRDMAFKEENITKLVCSPRHIWVSS